MTFTEATEVAAFAKELFPRSTDAQCVVVRDVCQAFPDTAFVRGLLKKFASETAILSIPMVRAELAAELRRRGETSEEYARRQQRMEWADTARRHEEVEALIADYSDDELAALKPEAIRLLTVGGEPKLTGAAAEFVARLHPRRSTLLKHAIYDLVKPHA